MSRIIGISRSWFLTGLVIAVVASSSLSIVVSSQLSFGPKGNKGDTGPQGLQGPIGDAGLQGPPGTLAVQGEISDHMSIGWTGDREHLVVNHLIPYNDKLYATIGVAGEIWSYNGTAWTQEYKHPYNEGLLPTGMRATMWCGTVFSVDGRLYFGAWAASASGRYRAAIFRSAGNGSWEYIDLASILDSDAEVFSMVEMIRSDDMHILAIGVCDYGNSLFNIYTSTDGSTWTLVHTVSGGSPDSAFAASDAKMFGDDTYFFASSADVGIQSTRGCIVKYTYATSVWSTITQTFPEGLTAATNLHTELGLQLMVGGAQGGLYFTADPSTLDVSAKVGQLDGCVTLFRWTTTLATKHGKKIYALISQSDEGSSVWVIEDIFKQQRIFATQMDTIWAMSPFMGSYFFGTSGIGQTSALDITKWYKSNNGYGYCTILEYSQLDIRMPAFTAEPFALQLWNQKVLSNAAWYYTDPVTVLGQREVGWFTRLWGGHVQCKIYVDVGDSNWIQLGATFTIQYEVTEDFHACGFIEEPVARIRLAMLYDTATPTYASVWITGAGG